MDQADFGALLREARQRALLSLEALAEASGVSVRAISDMERGRSQPRARTLAELLDVLALDERERRRLTEAARYTRPNPARQIPRQLPPDLRTFQGREDLLATAQRLTAEIGHGAGGGAGHVVVTAVGGMAGVGKTTFAVHWAHQVADRFPDGQLYVNLRGYDPSGRAVTPREALGGFLTALGVPGAAIPDEAEQRSVLFREHAAQRRLIVLLDNARDAEQVRPLLPGSAGCLTVITSRNRLPGLAAADDARLLDLDLWTAREALAALAARIGTERVEAEQASAARLVELCGRLPLAVAVLAAHLAAEPALSLRVAAAELTRAEERLDAFRTDDPRADLRAVFSWSYDALEPATARFFRHLAVHPGPALSAEAAASAAGEPMAAARRRLRDLAAASLLTRDAEGHYVLHDLLRAHGSELLDQEGEDRYAAQLRLLDHLRHNANAAYRALSTRPVARPDQPPTPGVVLVPFDGPEQALAWFQQEQRTIMAVLRTTDDPRLLHYRLSLADHCLEFFSAQGQWADEIAMQRLGLDAALLLDDPVRISSSAENLARALAEAGRMQEADRAVEVIERQLDRLEPRERAHAIRSTGWVRGRQGRHADALRYARTALEIYRTLPDRGHIARELNAVGWYLALLGRYDEAVASCREALPILQETGNRRNEAATWDSIGYALHRGGDLHEAADCFRTSARLYGEVLDRYNQAEVLDHLAEAQLALGEQSAAAATWLTAADLLDAIGNARAATLRARAQDTSAPAAPKPTPR